MAEEGQPTETELRPAIANILENGDLSRLTSKIVRTELEQKFGVSLLARKKEIDGLIMDMINKQQQSTTEEDDADEVDDDDDDDDDSDHILKDNDSQNQKKKFSKDEELARKLQEDENHRSKRRSASRQVNTQQKKSKKPVKNKEEKETKKKKSGFNSLLVLSPALAEVVGAERMSRAEVVKTMWRIIKERQLEDPKNKRMCVCDEQLEKVFGRKKFLTFGMMKYLSSHMKEPELLQ